MLNFLPVLLLSLGCVLSTGSCTSFSADYRQLNSAAQRDPSPDAIAGFWHYKNSAGGYTWSIVFNADGSGFFDGLKDDAFSNSETSGELQWRYQGSGIWRTSGVFPSSEWRISGANLLQETTDIFGTTGLIWNRVPR